MKLLTLILLLLFICLAAGNDYLQAPNGVLKVRELWVGGVKYVQLTQNSTLKVKELWVAGVKYTPCIPQVITPNPVFNTIGLRYGDTIGSYSVGTIILTKKHKLYQKGEPVGKKTWWEL